MRKLGDYIEGYIRSLNVDAAKLMRIAKNNDSYARAVERVWASPQQSNLILEHTNAFYVREDTTPRKGPDKDTPYIVYEACIDDPTVRAEMDARREMLRLALVKEGLDLNEFRIIPARRDMRKRHPFLSYLKEIPKSDLWT